MSRKKIENLPDNTIIGFKVEHSPRYTASQLAIMLGEAMQNSINFKADAKAFQEHSEFEIKKVRRFKALLKKLENRKKNPPEKVSRMDPLASYNETLILEELSQSKQRSKDFANMASKKKTMAIKEDSRVLELQKEIRELNNKESQSN